MKIMTHAHRLNPRHLAAGCLVLCLTGCGGGSGGPDNRTGATPVTTQPRGEITIPPRQRPVPTSGSIPVSADLRSGDRTIGIGPAFRHESPGPADLATRTAQGMFDIRSGRWRDPQGRDGSVPADEIVRFIRSAQSQTVREGGGGIVIDSRPGGPDILRMSSTATPDERAAVWAALRNINTARIWANRIRLGPELPAAAGDDPIQTPIPANEIHLRFTNGTAAWPRHDDQEHATETLGIGGRQFVGTAPGGGFAWIDRTKISSPTLREFVVIHEILHAAGFGVHVEEDVYPDSILSPGVDPNISDVPRLYLTIDGDVGQVNLPDGPLPSPLTVSDLGPWETDAFHLLATAVYGDDTNDALQFGAGFRNGLSKPWAWGSPPARRLADNPAFARAGTATWEGQLLGFTGFGRTVAGDARIGVDFRDATGEADFTSLESWARGSHPGTPGSGTRWGDGDLDYTLTLWEEGTRSGFDSSFAPGDDPGVVTGIFVGDAHQGATGVLEHPDLSAGFGGVR